jgi:DNA repair protein RecN (Recombination protein N)
MIISLYVENFVLIDSISLDFKQGFNVFTGETGAGKSLLVDAISLLCGAKASASLIKSNQESAKVEGVFLIKSGSLSESFAQEMGIDCSDVVVCSREISKDGRNVCRINGKIVPLSLIKDLMAFEIDIHSQHDTTYLLNEKQHLHLVDQVVDGSLKDDVKKAYQHYKFAKEQLESFQKSVLSEKDLDFARFQLAEIEAFNPSIEDFEACEQDIKRMSAYEKLVSKTSQVIDLFDQDQGVLSMLYQSMKLLQSCHEDEVILQASQSMNEVVALSDDIRTTLYDRLKTFTFDQDVFDDLNHRVLGYEKLKRKHGGSLESLLRIKEELSHQILMVDDHEFHAIKLAKEVNSSFKLFETKAQELSSVRQQSASQLESGINQQLSDLSLPHAQFKIIFSEDKPSSSGIDKVVFHIKTNPGSPMGPLSKIASGGELSRLMLGLKTVFTPLADIQVLIFDEIDVGISGPIAKQIGLKMRQLSQTIQVFSITHLAMVAAVGDRHFRVSKHVENDVTHVDVLELNRFERIEELALIASGSLSESSIQAAKELLESVHE